MTTSGNISIFYGILGIFSSAIISIAAFHLKLIEKKSELLYLSLGFYAHFVKIFIKNFFSSIKFITIFSFTRAPLLPAIYHIKINEDNKVNLAILMTTINMTTGLFAMGLQEDELLIHALDKDYFAKFDFKRVCSSLKNINDDNIV